MKKTILYILLCLITGTALAQVQTLKPGDYVEVPANKKFEGKWRVLYKKDTVTITLLSKKTYLKDFNIYADHVSGDYQINNKTFIHGAFDDPLKSGIFGGMATKENPNLLKASFNDFRHGNSFDLTIELISSDKTLWSLQPREKVVTTAKNLKTNHTGSFLPKKFTAIRIR